MAKKEIFKVSSKEVDPAEIANPTTAQDFFRRGMAYYARKQYDQAISDLKKANSLDAAMVDAYYSLGMVYKALSNKEESVKAFQQALDLITSSQGKTRVTNDMLRRLALGHINEQTQGDWNLEKEIWQHIE